MMDFVSSNNHSSSYDTTRPSLSFALQQIELDDHEAPTLHDDPFSNDFLDVEGFAANPSLFLSPQVSPPAGLRNVQPFAHSHVIGEPQCTGRLGPQQPTSSFGSFSGPVIHPAVAPQSPFDGTYSLQNPSAWAGPSTAWYGGGEQAAFAGGQNMAAAVPSMSGTVPMAMTAPAAAPSFPSMYVTAPMSGTPEGARMPIVRPWDADAATAAGAGASFARTAPRSVPTFCRCNLRAHPFVRVDDTIEWVRPDLMRMVVWFNWSLNAEAEAHEPWEPRRG
jgi:hypothetical protein